MDTGQGRTKTCPKLGTAYIDGGCVTCKHELQLPLTKIQQRSLSDGPQHNGLFAPGSRGAIDRGCLCPVLDNAHGVGYLGVEGMYVYVEGCPTCESWGQDGSGVRADGIPESELRALDGAR